MLLLNHFALWFQILQCKLSCNDTVNTKCWHPTKQKSIRATHGIPKIMISYTNSIFTSSCYPQAGGNITPISTQQTKLSSSDTDDHYCSKPLNSVQRNNLLSPCLKDILHCAFCAFLELHQYKQTFIKTSAVPNMSSQFSKQPYFTDEKTSLKTLSSLCTPAGDRI